MTIFNGTKYTDAPMSWGEVEIVYEQDIWYPKPTKEEGALLEIPYATLETLAATFATNARVVMDIEFWPIKSEIESERWQAICKYKEVARYLKHLRPDINLGHYSVPPMNSPQPAANKDPLWFQQNEALAAVADFVDTLYPTCYARFNDFSRQYLQNDSYYEVCLQFGKPIVPFVCPRYTSIQDPGAGSAQEQDLLSQSQMDSIMDYFTDRGLDLVVWDYYTETTMPDILQKYA